MKINKKFVVIASLAATVIPTGSGNLIFSDYLLNANGTDSYSIVLIASGSISFTSEYVQMSLEAANNISM